MGAARFTCYWMGRGDGLELLALPPESANDHSIGYCLWSDVLGRSVRFLYTDHAAFSWLVMKAGKSQTEAHGIMAEVLQWWSIRRTDLHPAAKPSCGAACVCGQ